MLKKLILSLLLATADKAFATDGTWSADAASQWTNTTRWIGGTVAGGAGSKAEFTNNITAARTITIDVPITNGTLILGDSVSTFYGYTFAGSGAGYLLFDGNGSAAMIDRSYGGNQTDTFSVPVRLNTDLIISNNIAGPLTLSGGISNINGSVATIYNQGTGTGVVSVAAIVNGGANDISVIQNTDSNILSFGASSLYTAGTYVKKGSIRHTSATTPFGMGTIWLGDTTGTNDATWIGNVNGSVTNRVEVASGNTGKARITSITGNLTASGPVWLNNKDLYVSGPTVIFFGGTIAGTGNVFASFDSGGIDLYSSTLNPVGVLSNYGSGSAYCRIGLIGSNCTHVYHNITNDLRLNGGSYNFSGGITMQRGGIVLQTSPGAAGSGVLELGDSSINANISLSLGASATFATPILVRGGNTGTVQINNGGNGGLSGQMWLDNHDVTIVCSGFTFSKSTGPIYGTGTVICASTGGAIGISSAFQNVGVITNNGTGSGAVTISGIISNGITRVVQDSTTSPMIISGSNGLYTAGINIKRGQVTLSTSGFALGTGDTVLGDTTGSDRSVIIPNINACTWTNRLVVRGGNTGSSVLSNSATAGSAWSGQVHLDNHDLDLTGSGGNTLTISTAGLAGTGTVRMTTLSTGGITISGPMQQEGAITNNGTGSGAGTLSGVISNGVTQVVQDSTTSPMAISGANSSFAGNVIIKRGRISTSTSAFSLGSSTLQLGVNGINSDVLFIPGNSVVHTNGVFVSGGNTGSATISNSANSQISGPIWLDNHDLATYSGSSSLAKLNGSFGGTGSVVIACVGTGTLTISNSLNQVGAITNNGAGSGLTTLSGAISNGVAQITQASATSPMTLSGANHLFTGIIIVTNGTLTVSSSNSCSSLYVYSGSTCLWTSATLPAMTNAGDVYLTTGGKLDIITGKTQTVNTLYIDSTQQVAGTWGSTTSAAANVSAAFNGLGILNVTNGPSAVVTSTWQVRYIVPPPSTFYTTNILTHPGNWTSRTFAAAAPSWVNPNSEFMWQWRGDTNFYGGTQSLDQVGNVGNYARLVYGTAGFETNVNPYASERITKYGSSYGDAMYMCSNVVSAFNTTNYSMMCWVKMYGPSDANGTRLIESDNVAGTRNIGLIIVTATSNAAIQTYAGATKQVTGTSVIPTGVWTHVSASVTGTLASVYVNGILESTGTVASITEAVATAFGGYPFLPGFSTQGGNDRGATHIYSRGLSSNEIFNQWYNTPPTTNIGNGYGNIEVRP